MTTIFAKTALLPIGWRQDVRVTFAGGRIAGVETDVAAQPGDATCAILLPGMPNLHSHAFQRGMAGLAEVRGHGADSFWSWRETMYRFALSMTPDELEAVAGQLYVEMLEAGFTRVGEFHYLHHAPDGRPYDDLGEMAVRIAAAADATGIGLTLLPVFYAHSTFGGASPNPQQRRFINDLDGFAGLLERSRKIVAPLAGGIVGVAPHSLRAVTGEELGAVVAMAGTAPIHIHVAEQRREVEDCVAFSGRRTIELLYDSAEIDGRWCLIHATHINDAELASMVRSGAVAGLCPVTEANLGDGTFRATEFLGAGGAFGIGSDSNVLIGLGDELRQLEYSQRLRDGTRNALAGPGGSTGRTLFDGALRGGAQALGVSGAGIAAGAPADLVSLNSGHAALVAREGDAILDSLIFAANGAVDGVWVAGKQIVASGRHVKRDETLRRFTGAMRQLRARSGHATGGA